jgi:P-type Ca2+ transporter type 2C
LAFQLSTAVAALSLITLSTALQLPNPLNPMQILFINILMDGPPSQSLGVDPVNPKVMKRPPRKKGEPVITRRLIGRILFSALLIVLGVLYIYAREFEGGEMEGRDQTMTFSAFVLLDLTSAFQNRSLSTNYNGNSLLLTTISISLLTLLSLIYFQPLQKIFQTTVLSGRDLRVLFTLVLVSWSLHEVRRAYERRMEDKEDRERIREVGRAEV